MHLFGEDGNNQHIPLNILAITKLSALVVMYMRIIKLTSFAVAHVMLLW